MKTSMLIEFIQDWAKSYLKAATENVVAKGLDKTSTFIATVITMLFMIALCLVIFIFFTISLALWIGEYTGKAYLGFIAAALLNIMITLFFYIFRVAWLKRPLAEKLNKELKKNLRDN